jgi:hypothetical protein
MPSEGMPAYGRGSRLERGNCIPICSKILIVSRRSAFAEVSVSTSVGTSIRPAGRFILLRALWKPPGAMTMGLPSGDKECVRL